MPAWVVPAIGAATSLIGGMMGSKGEKQAAQAAQAHQQLTERARQDAMGALTDQQLYSAANMLFPGLMQMPGSMQPQGPQRGPAARAAAFQQMRSGRKPGLGSGLRALGTHPVAAALRMPRQLQAMQERTAAASGPNPFNWGTGQFADAEAARMVSGRPQQGDWGYMGPGASPTLNPVAAIFGAGSRQQGGPVQQGKPYVVGEAGPEVMVPQQSGTVVPNQAVNPYGMGAAAAGAFGGRGQQPTPMPQNQQQPVGGGLALGGAALQQQGGLPGLQPGAQQQQQPQQPQQQQQGWQPGQRFRERMQGRLQDRMQTAEGNLPDTAPGMFTPGGPGAMRGAQVAGQEQPGNIGQMVTDYTRQYLEDPGQLGSEAYERAQEQANQGLNTTLMGITGHLAQQGIDPNSPMGQAMTQAATLSAAKQRNEAARDYTMAQEALRREDIARATADYITMLQTIFGLQGQRAQAAAGTGFSPAQAINPYSGIATGLGTAGAQLANYFSNRPDNTSGGVVLSPGEQLNRAMSWGTMGWTS